MGNLTSKWFGLFLLTILVLSLEGSTRGQTRKATRSSSKVPKKVPSTITPVSHDALNSQMTFRLVSTCDARTCSVFILAEGVITATSAGDLETFLTTHAKNKWRNFDGIYFNSLGGSLYGGILLGRTIRKYEISTIAGSFGDVDDPDGLLPRNAVCYSACAYAFMGGSTRSVTTGSKLGLHQFRSTVATDEGSTQITMAVLGKYLDDMGIRRKVLDIAALTLPDKIRLISVKEAEAWNIASNDIEEGEWTLRNLDDGSLFLTLSQREYENRFVLLLYRDGAGYILQILFTKKQKVRKPSELREIFNDMADVEPSLCIDQPAGPCLREVPFKIAEGWRMNDKLVASISLRLSRAAVISIANGSKLDFDANFPMAYVDIWPSVTVSTAKLKGLINALDKSQ